MLIGKVFENEIFDLVILKKNNFARILMDMGFFSDFSYFYLIIFGWLALVAVVNYYGSKGSELL